MHFPAKEDLLLAGDPFTAASLAERLSGRGPGDLTLDVLRSWLAETLRALEADHPERATRTWRRGRCVPG